MKKSFTMLELIFVIVVIGIISATILPRTESNSLEEAALQVISHIRYTQHLAMVDDRYDKDDKEWYQERWRIRFKKDLTYTNPKEAFKDIWTYMVFSDANSHDGNAHLSEMARNPQNQNQYLSGGYNNTLYIYDSKAMKRLQLGLMYGIEDVKFGGGCRSNIEYIYFDHFGRPFNSMNKTKPYERASSGWHKLLTSDCKISLYKKNSKIVINIAKETGYVCILDKNNLCKR